VFNRTKPNCSHRSASATAYATSRLSAEVIVQIVNRDLLGTVWLKLNMVPVSL